MKKSVSVAFAIILGLYFSLRGFCVPADSPRNPPSLHKSDISAKSAILIDYDSGAVLFEKEPDLRLGMASTTKLMTAITALRLGDPNKLITVPPSAVGIEGSSVYLVEGEQLTLSELLHALLLSSANDAAVAIAVALAGSEEAFVEKMNIYAEELGLKCTHFTNPHGLYNKEHYTTARELSKIAAEVLKSDIAADIVSKRKATISHDGIPDKRLLVNHNKMLSYYEGAIGMKTGFTKMTGRTLVSAAKRDGMTLIAVTLDAPNDWRDHTAMLDFGFNNYERIQLFDTGEFVYELSLSGAERQTVRLVNRSPIYMTFRKGRQSYDLKIYGYGHFLIAPVKEGDIFGEAILCGELCAVRGEIVIGETVDGSTKPKLNFFERIIDFFTIE